ncbi:hypothetical protein A3A20_01480 [Candidatus Wolfebacteria bacterium RIFCSPLOWO2_01_FULL_45_19]|uniref:Uncharacterized protein n=1 Tax=Candidatus Wolfebacteria bacterium RIFCSPLOWO2_01_FULL_45_19 TaxID=1802557 RepID=A0A1F8DSM2_9BACT|nr:MAG: hypothetical protein A3A20_01480 [Candidatus Wolfebacteria bacterium RIFCSPLOWO2_01_FULL_45_19]
MTNITEDHYGQHRCKTCRAYAEKTWICRKKESADEYEHLEKEYCPKCDVKPSFYPPGHPKEKQE